MHWIDSLIGMKLNDADKLISSKGYVGIFIEAGKPIDEDEIDHSYENLFLEHKKGKVTKVIEIADAEGED
jgi:hypothetical protein